MTERTQHNILFTTILCASFLLFSEPTHAIDVSVTARVPGCGDGIIEVGIAEQCEDTDLNGNTCSMLGYTGGGSLSCTSVCTYNVTSCISGTSTGGGGGGRRPRLSTDTTDQAGFIVFSGIAEPGSQILVLDGQGFLTSGYTDINGRFKITYVDPPTNQYDFTFVNVSDKTGLSQSIGHSMYVESDIVTQISGIIFSPSLLDEKSPSIPINTQPGQVNVDQINQTENVLSNKQKQLETFEQKTETNTTTSIEENKIERGEIENNSGIIGMYKSLFAPDTEYRDKVDCVLCVVVRRDIDEQIGQTKQKIIKFNLISEKNEWRIPVSKLDARPSNHPNKIADVEGFSLFISFASLWIFYLSEKIFIFLIF